MVTMQFSFDDRDVKKKMQAMLDAGKDLKVPLMQAAVFIVRQTDLAFANQTSPSGKRWPKLKLSTIIGRLRQKQKGRRIKGKHVDLGEGKKAWRGVRYKNTRATTAAGLTDPLILHNTGLLHRTVTGRGKPTPQNVKADAVSIEFGSADIRAKTHNFGRLPIDGFRAAIPQRTFLEITPAAVNMANQKMLEHYEKTMNGTAGGKA